MKESETIEKNLKLGISINVERVACVKINAE